MRHHNTLASELKRAKALGFEATSVNARARNPFMLLADGSCLLWLAGGLIARVTTKVHFGNHLHCRRWKSSDGNKPNATLTTTEINSNGTGYHTEIYYREAFKKSIQSYAQEWEVEEASVILDHINHIRGDCRRENLRLATTAQNNANRSSVKVEKAFYTEEDLKANITSGVWVPLRTNEKVGDYE